MLRALAFFLFQPFSGLLGLCLLAVLLHQLVEHLPGRNAAIPNGGIHIVQVGHVESFEDVVKVFRLGKFGKLPALPPCSLGKHLLAALNVFFAVRLFKPLAGLRFGLLGFNDFEPVAARGGVGRGDDLHYIVVFQFVIEPHNCAVDLCVLRVVAHV